MHRTDSDDELEIVGHDRLADQIRPESVDRRLVLARGRTAGLQLILELADPDPQLVALGDRRLEIGDPVAEPLGLVVVGRADGTVRLATVPPGDGSQPQGGPRVFLRGEARGRSWKVCRASCVPLLRSHGEDHSTVLRLVLGGVIRCDRLGFAEAGRNQLFDRHAALDEGGEHDIGTTLAQCLVARHRSRRRRCGHSRRSSPRRT